MAEVEKENVAGKDVIEKQSAEENVAVVVYLLVAIAAKHAIFAVVIVDTI